MKETAVVTAFPEKLWREEVQLLDLSQRPRLDALRAQLESDPAPQFTRLATRRLLVSNTLRDGDLAARVRWEYTNQEPAAAMNE